MTKIQNSKQVVFGYWNLKFIWDLMVEIWDFKLINYVPDSQ